MDGMRRNNIPIRRRDSVSKPPLHSPDRSHMRPSRRRHLHETTFMGHCLALGHRMFEIRDKIFLQNHS